MCFVIPPRPCLPLQSALPLPHPFRFRHPVAGTPVVVRASPLAAFQECEYVSSHLLAAEGVAQKVAAYLR